MRRILDETSLERLRLSSIEPMDVTEDLIALVASSERIARHFHMPCNRAWTASSPRCTAGIAPSSTRAASNGFTPGCRTPPSARTSRRLTRRNASGTQRDARIYPRFAVHLSPRIFFLRAPRYARSIAQDSLPAETVAERARGLRAFGAEKKSGFLRAQIGKTMRVFALNPPARRAQPVRAPYPATMWKFASPATLRRISFSTCA